MIYRRVYSFDPVQFHYNLEARVIKGGELRLDLLRELAIQIATHPSDTTRQVLEDIRFGYHEEDLEAWFGNADDMSNLDPWYVIALAEVLVPSPNLRAASHNVMRRVLPLAGWDAGQIKRLLAGADLNKLPRSYGDEPLRHEFVGLTQYGGWLDLPDTRSLIADVQALEGYFLPASHESLEAIEGYVLYFPKQHRPSRQSLLETAYGDAIATLQTAIDREHALFISFD